MLELITFKQAEGSRIQNYSPFCSKVETFLKLNDIEFKHTEFNGPLKRFPKEKLPVIIHNGKMISDSHFILEYLTKNFSITMDKGLKQLDHAQGRAFISMIEEHLYWALVCERWMEDKNWNRLKLIFLKGVPRPIAFLIGNMARKNIIKNCIGQGYGRFSLEERLKIAKEIIQSISIFIGSKSFVFGEKISSYDAIFYATLSNILYSDLSPKLQQEVLKYKNLEEYCVRVESLFQKKVS